MSAVYEWLMAGDGGGDPLDRHVFACVLSVGVSEVDRPLTEALGLQRAEVEDLVAAYFPAARWLCADLPANDTVGDLAAEEQALRRLLLDNASRPSREVRWLSAIIARRSLLPRPLWQDLGLHSAAELAALLGRHFAPLAAWNPEGIGWKRFLYNRLYEAQGLRLSTSPNCMICDDAALCSGGGHDIIPVYAAE